MPPPDGTYHRDKHSKEDGDPVIYRPDIQSTTHEPAVPHDTSNVGALKHNQVRATEMPSNYALHEVQGPAVPPKDPRSPMQPVSAKNPFNKMKKSFKARERERDRHSSKDTPCAPNDSERIRDQDRQIKVLEDTVNECNMHIRDLEKAVQHYQSRLQEEEVLKQELSSIRQNLLLDDEDEPWVIVKNFEEINKKVDSISLKLRNALCGADARQELTTSDLVEGLTAHNESTVPTKAIHPIGADEFIELGCRAMLNRFLLETALNRRMMNPDWDVTRNELCYAILKSVQAKGMKFTQYNTSIGVEINLELEAQVNAGRWRISTFKTIPAEAHTRWETETKRFCDGSLFPFCKIAYRTEACSAAMRLVAPDIIALLNQAYSWSYRTRSTILMLDFRVVYYSPGSQFNISSAELDGSEAKLGIPEVVFLTSKLGLLSYKTTGDGNRQYVCQAKALVLGEGYFCT
ncbi:hypothetical protein RHS04_07679 [Rhizoctonia solani]|uniref:Uncharacterized protein n=1 Tax=Rhizoctonia solani TaxID=456999 RepID=A0A8H7H2L0_9AGAM|nr:hypothetical protein RHS04_07679 [Rhizoctonia solani]